MLVFLLIEFIAIWKHEQHYFMVSITGQKVTVSWPTDDGGSQNCQSSLSSSHALIALATSILVYFSSLLSWSILITKIFVFAAIGHQDLCYNNHEHIWYHVLRVGGAKMWSGANEGVPLEGGEEAARVLDRPGLQVQHQYHHHRRHPHHHYHHHHY